MFWLTAIDLDCVVGPAVKLVVRLILLDGLVLAVSWLVVVSWRLLDGRGHFSFEVFWLGV